MSATPSWVIRQDTYPSTTTIVGTIGRFTGNTIAGSVESCAEDNGSRRECGGMAVIRHHGIDIMAVSGGEADGIEGCECIELLAVIVSLA